MDSETGGQAHIPGAAEADAGTQMRMARENVGLSLAEVAARTRVPLRHLEALERGDYGALPGITYCAGFARAYARAVGLDEKALTAKVRSEIDAGGEFTADPYQISEPADPARVPPRFLAWTAAVIALVLAGGYSVWRMQVNTPPSAETIAQDNVAPVVPHPAARRPVAAPATSPVVLTAADDAWLRIYDASGKALFEGTLAKGQSYTVPADANNPMILTGRPDALAITVAGRAIPPLGTAERTIADVPISGEALLRRVNGAPDVAVSAGAAPPAPSTSAVPPVTAPAATAPQPRVAAPVTSHPHGASAGTATTHSHGTTRTSASSHTAAPASATAPATSVPTLGPGPRSGTSVPVAAPTPAPATPAPAQ